MPFLPLLLALLPGAAPLPPTPPTIPPPPPPGDRPLMIWSAGEMRCAGGPVTPVSQRRPAIDLGWGTFPPQNDLTLRFAIDAEGRPTGIRQEPAGYRAFSDDVTPAFAVTRFPAGEERQDCRVTWHLSTVPVGQAPVEDLVSYSTDQRSGPLPQHGWDRIAAGGTCADAPRPMPLLQGTPDLMGLPGTPGARQWTLIGYDTDRSGKPVKVRVRYGTRDAALDVAAVKAIGQSRYTQGARLGCLYPFVRPAVKLAAPPIPDRDYRPAGATCPAEHAWATPPQLTFPEAWRRRSIEGWAVIAYDVAPWGEPGNLRVLASEPAEAFGTQAMSVIRSARLAPAAAGMTGCIARVRFAMGPEGGVPPAPPPPPPPPVATH